MFASIAREVLVKADSTNKSIIRLLQNDFQRQILKLFLRHNFDVEHVFFFSVAMKLWVFFVGVVSLQLSALRFCIKFVTKLGHSEWFSHSRMFCGMLNWDAATSDTRRIAAISI